MAENNLNDLQRHSAIQDARISNLETKFEMFMHSMEMSLAEMRERDKIRAEEMQDFKNEMRDRDNRRAEEIAEIRKTNENLNAKIDEKFERLLSQIQNMAIATVVGVGAVVAAVVSIMKP